MKCDRCHRETDAHIMSMFNTDILCFDCKDKEELDPRYEEARRAESEAVLRGDFNFPGIGFDAVTQEPGHDRRRPPTDSG